MTDGAAISIAARAIPTMFRTGVFTPRIIVDPCCLWKNRRTENCDGRREPVVPDLTRNHPGFPTAGDHFRPRLAGLTIRCERVGREVFTDIPWRKSNVWPPSPRSPAPLPARAGKRGAGPVSSWPPLNAHRHSRRPREDAGSGGGACGQYGNRCCCSGSRRCSCCGWRTGGSSVCCSRNRRATRGIRGAARLPGRVEPSAPKDRLAQAPRISMLGMGGPRGHTPLNLVARYRARAPPVPQTA